MLWTACSALSSTDPQRIPKHIPDRRNAIFWYLACSTGGLCIWFREILQPLVAFRLDR